MSRLTPSPIESHTRLDKTCRVCGINFNIPEWCDADATSDEVYNYLCDDCIFRAMYILEAWDTDLGVSEFITKLYGLG